MSRFQNSYGIGYRFEDHLVFFGGKNFDEAAFHSEFPGNSVFRIRQTHSSIALEASKEIREADAHFTTKKSAALVVATADCIPLMIYCHQTHHVAAVHAGWKGIQNQITCNILSSLHAAGSTENNFKFYIGPHIQQNSFETDIDVFESMATAHPRLDTAAYSTFKNGKYYLNLSYLMKYQIEKTIQKPAKISNLKIDTKTSDDFYSYRRGKHSRERNLSFILRLQGILA